MQKKVKNVATETDRNADRFYQDSLAEFVDDRLENQNWASGTEYSQWLTREKAISYAADKTGNQRFHSGHVFSGGLAEEATESNDGRQTGKIQENERRDTLKRKSVLDVGKIKWSFPLNVIDQTAE